MTAPEWLQAHWLELTAALGIGSGSGLLSKKLIDKSQDKKIEKLEARVDKNTSDIQMISNRLQTNTEFDKQLRVDFREHRDSLDKRFDRLEKKHDEMMKFLFSLKKA